MFSSLMLDRIAALDRGAAVKIRQPTVCTSLPHGTFFKKSSRPIRPHKTRRLRVHRRLSQVRLCRRITRRSRRSLHLSSANRSSCRKRRTPSIIHDRSTSHLGGVANRSHYIPASSIGTHTRHHTDHRLCILQLLGHSHHVLPNYSHNSAPVHRLRPLPGIQSPY